MDEEKMSEQQLKRKGGLKTIPFIMTNEIFERVASIGLTANMTIYLTKEYHMTPATSAIVLLIWGAVTNFLPIFGAFLSDSYLGRFRVIAIGSVACLNGMVLLWLTAELPGAKPPACDLALHKCQSPSHSQLALLYSAFALISVGTGGIRPCSLAFGADQFNRPDNPQNERTLQTFFNWYYASVGVSVIIAVTVIIYIQDKKGWRVGFGVPVVLMALSIICFLLGYFLYVKVRGRKSMLTGLAQVVVASVRNRQLVFPSEADDDWWYHREKGSKIMVPTEKIRCLNKACVVRNPEKDLNPDGAAADPWKLCTVEQVEYLKSMVRVMPIWSTGIMAAVIISQHSFPALQANSMDRHMSSRFEIPASSFVVFGITTLTLWVAIYDRLIVPRLANITGRPRGLTLKQRMGIGLVLSCAATAVAATVERTRRRRAIEQGVADNEKAVIDMSAMWLVPQYCLTGLSEAFNIIGQIEFYYSELPKTMASIAVALLSLGWGVGDLVGALIVVLVKKISAGNGRVGWLDSNLNEGHYDYYYWILTLLSVVNVFYFLVCSWAYGEEGKNRFGEKDDLVEELASKSGELSIVL
ncbi:protein NRT1/ PTR FAMILY 1.2-like [Phoenix dactylifera]|uniref:Protein NRT1/ PTR FAMILY 1.2-like n=1 Tax=Phoenix dactylifera TaxID=42345 RepID=A0A8B7C792_PHODC|nr:protein NRT1/ PTR FAMILY 1.2-like [Phoenix dactylifera]